MEMKQSIWYWTFYMLYIITAVVSCPITQGYINDDKGLLVYAHKVLYIYLPQVVNYFVTARITMSMVTHVVVNILSNLIIYRLLRYSRYHNIGIIYNIVFRCIVTWRLMVVAGLSSKEEWMAL